MAAFAAATSGGYRLRTASFDYRSPYGNTFHSLYNGPAGLRCIDFAPRKRLRQRRHNQTQRTVTNIHDNVTLGNFDAAQRMRADSLLTVSTRVSEDSSVAGDGNMQYMQASDVAKTILNHQQKRHFLSKGGQHMQSFEQTVVDSQPPADTLSTSTGKTYISKSSYHRNSSASSSEDFDTTLTDNDNESDDNDDDSVGGGCFAEDTNKKYRFQNFTELVSDANAWLRAHPDMRVVNCESILMLANRQGDVETKSEFTIHNDTRAYHQRYVRLLRVWMQPSDICGKSSQGISGRHRTNSSSNDSTCNDIESDQQHRQADQIGFRDLSGAFESFPNDVVPNNNNLSADFSSTSNLNELIRKFNDNLIVEEQLRTYVADQEENDNAKLRIGRLICVHTIYANAREIMTHQLRFRKLLSFDRAAPVNFKQTPLVLDPSTLLPKQQKAPLSASKSARSPVQVKLSKSDHLRKGSKKLQRHKSNKTDSLTTTTNDKKNRSQPAILKWYQVLRIFYTLPTTSSLLHSFENGHQSAEGVAHGQLELLKAEKVGDVQDDEEIEKKTTPNGFFIEDFWPSPLDEDSDGNETYYENPCLAVETLPSLFDKIADWVQARAATIRVLNFQTIFVPEQYESSLETSYAVQVKNDGQPTRVRMRKVIRLNYTNVKGDDDADNVDTGHEDEEQIIERGILNAHGLSMTIIATNNKIASSHRSSVVAQCDKLARKQSHTLLSHKLFYPGTVKEERMTSGFISGRTVESARHVLGRIDAWAAKECAKVINVETITTPYSTGVERNYGFDLLMTEINVAADTPSLFVGEFLHIYRVYCDGFYSDDSVQSKIDPPTDPSESCTIL